MWFFLYYSTCFTKGLNNKSYEKVKKSEEIGCTNFEYKTGNLHIYVVEEVAVWIMKFLL